MNISISAESLFGLGGFPVTNSFLMTLIVSLLLATGLFVARLRLQLVPGRGQSFLEALVDGLNGLMESVLDDKQLARRFFPLIATFFLFILVSNWIGLVPGAGTIGLHHGEHGIIPFLRAGTADLNTTIALSIISVFAVQVTGIGMLGVTGYAKKFLVAPWKKPYVIGTLVGLLELVSEATKLISFSFRLFGNIFAGEVLLVVMFHLVPYIVPLPFLFLEVFAGLIQAVVFAILTLVFLKMSTVPAEH